MSLNIKNEEVERLVDEVARMTGETKTEAIRKALSERRQRLAFRVSQRGAGRRFLEYLDAEVWPAVPKKELGRRLTKKERERILGYGPEGV